ncbi:MAG TPA: S1-like domain-containing RNA-binding protein [Moraxellaceae bacterium]|nr:S1-like domain-containing RNA-binding protein [Moraxellaceae bacterium]
MILPGSLNTLQLRRFAGPGAFLGEADDSHGPEILLPGSQVPKDAEVGDVLEVFVYLDSEDRPVATTKRPRAMVGEVATLRIVDANDAGLFLDWGLPKDLLLPHNEIPRAQKLTLEPGRFATVMVFQDDTGRVAASARLEDFIAKEADGFTEGDPVRILVFSRTDLGWRVIVNDRYWGLVHNNEVFGTLKSGERREGWVKALRGDGRLNIALVPPGRAKVDPVAQKILDRLAQEGGFMSVGDKTPPEAIYAVFGVSKKVFKQAIGSLFKERRIVIEPAGIRLVK